MTRTITTYILTTIMIITMMVPVSMAQAQTPAQTLTPQQSDQLTTSLSELLSAVKGLQAALTTAPTGQVLGVSIANNAPVIDGETYTVTGPGEIIRGTEGVDLATFSYGAGIRVEALHTSAETALELGGIDRDQPAYAVYEHKAEADFGNGPLRVSYWNINANQVSSDDTTPLSETALETSVSIFVTRT